MKAAYPLKTCMSLGLVFALIGCTRAPTDSEALTAYQQEVGQVNHATEQLGSSALAITVHSVHVLNCERRADTDQYRCEAQVETTLPLIGRQTQNTTLTFGKTDHGWVVVRGTGN